MPRNVYSLALIAICASTVLASAQVSSSPTDAAPTTTTVAYVYVSSSPSSGKYQINGYSAASTGKLTAISGSPFSANASYGMAVNGKWMFESDGFNLFSLSIASNGSLKQVSEVIGDGKTLLQDLSLDHTGATLYVGAVAGAGDNGYEFFTINQTTGGLSFIGSVGGSDPDYGNTPLAFIADNVYAYSSFCALLAPDIFGFQRSSSGTLTALNILPSMPSGASYCPYKAAPDTTTHVAIPVWNTSTQKYQLSVYTADSSGNLTTKSTSSNMPFDAVGNINDISASPSGKYLAVGGSTGLQFFHYNGANPITKFTGALVSGKSIDQVFWDNASHLYAISQSGGKLYVFNVTSTGATQASGSPYSIAGTEHLIVLPK